MISKFVFAASSLAGVGGYLFRKREKMFSKIYQDLSFNVIPSYDFSNALDTNSLPNGNSFIILNTITQHHSGNKFQSYFNKEDKFVKSSNPINFTIQNPTGLTLQIINSSNQEIMYYNLKKKGPLCSFSELEKKLGQQFQLSPIQGFIQKRQQFVENIIEEDEEHIFIGYLQNKSGNLIMKPKIIIRGEISGFIRYLDGFLVENNKKGKICFGVCAGLVISHIIISRFLFPQYFVKPYRSGPALDSEAEYKMYMEKIQKRQIGEKENE